MKKVISNLAIIISTTFMILIISAGRASAVDLGTQAQQLQNFDYNRAADFGKIETLVSSQASTFIKNKIGYDIKSWSVPYTGVNGNVINRDGLKETLMENLEESYPEQIRAYLEENLLKDMGDDPEMAARIEELIENITQEAVANLEDVIDDSMNNFDPRKSFADNFLEKLGASIGSSTSKQLELFATSQLQNSLGLGEGADLAAHVNEQMHDAGNAIQEFNDDLTGMSAQELEANMNSVLKESGLPNPYDLDAGDYLSYNSPASAGVDLPTVEIPGAAYSVVQIASGVGHYMRSVGFLYINTNEIKKGTNCLKTASWVMSDKNRAFTVVGGKVGTAGVLPNAGSQLSGSVTGELKGVINQVENIDLSDTANKEAVRTQINNSISKLGDIKVQIDKHIVETRKNLASAPTFASVTAPEVESVLPSGDDVQIHTPVELPFAEEGKARIMLSFSDDQRGEDGKWGGQCVHYVREYFRPQVKEETIYGCLPGLSSCNKDMGAYNAWECWDLGSGRGFTPQVNSIMVMDKVPSSKSLKVGHVAVVREVKENTGGMYSTYTLTIDESNWSNSNDELVDREITYVYDPVRKTVKREKDKTEFPIRGFIYGPSSIIDCNDKDNEYAEQRWPAIPLDIGRVDDMKGDLL